MARRKPMAGLAALMTAGALAVPAASASAQIAPNPLSPIPGTPYYATCHGLVNQVQFALAVANPQLANAYALTFIYLGCGGAAI